MTGDVVRVSREVLWDMFWVFAGRCVSGIARSPSSPQSPAETASLAAHIPYARISGSAVARASTSTFSAP